MKKRYRYLTLASLSAFLMGCFGGAIDPNPDWTIDVAATRKSVTLNTYFPASGVSNHKFQNGFIPTGLESLTGYKVQYNQTSDQADTQVNALLTGKDKVDMLKIGPTLFNNYVTSGYFTDLTEGIDKYAPNLKTLSGITEEQWKACTYEGKIYAIPEIGHTHMVNVGMVWNMDHLKEVGIEKMPKTISQFDEALVALQNHFGANGNYHALGLAGTMSEANPLAAAFDMPKNWYENSQNELENMLFSERTEAYLSYMHTLHERNMIASGWKAQTEGAVMNNFIRRFSSVMVASYWSMTPLRESIIAAYDFGGTEYDTEVKKTAHVYGKASHEYGVAPSDAMIQWEVYLLGDGSKGTNVQPIGMARDTQSAAYYITVPVASAKKAAYTLDWVNQKQTEEATILNFAGKEGKHWEKTTSSNPDAIKLNTAKDEQEEYVKILPDFYEDISGMSQYQTAVNPSIARKWFPVAEAGFKAWPILVLNEKQLILDKFAFHPVLKEFAKVDLLAQNFVVTNLQEMINKGTDKILESSRKEYLAKYWKDEVKNEVNSWYRANKTI